MLSAKAVVDSCSNRSTTKKVAASIPNATARSYERALHGVASLPRKKDKEFIPWSPNDFVRPKQVLLIEKMEPSHGCKKSYMMEQERFKKAASYHVIHLPVGPAGQIYATFGLGDVSSFCFDLFFPWVGSGLCHHFKSRVRILYLPFDLLNFPTHSTSCLSEDTSWHITR